MQSRGANNGLNMTESYQGNIQHTWSISLTRVSALGRNRFVPHYLELILKLHLMYQCISRPNIAWAPFCHATTGLLLSMLRSLCPGCHSLNLDFLLFPFCPSCKQLGDPRRLSFLSYLKTRRGPCRLQEQTLLLLYLTKNTQQRGMAVNFEDKGSSSRSLIFFLSRTPGLVSHPCTVCKFNILNLTW